MIWAQRRPCVSCAHLQPPAAHMHDTIRDLTSAHWWITVAVASLILNILAAYFVRWLDRLFPNVSKRVFSWTGSKMSDFEKDINRASRDNQLMVFLAARGAGLHVGAIHNYVVGTLFFYTSGKVMSSPILSGVLLVIGFLFTIAGSRDFGGAMRCRFIIDRVQKGWKVSTDQASNTQPQ